MLTLYKVALAPALLWQGRNLRATALRLPEAAGDRAGVIAGASQPLRILFVGDSSAAGVGVDWQHEALALPTACKVAAATQKEVHWQLVAQSGANTRDAIAMVENVDHLQPADVVVSALGVNDVTGQTSTRQFVADYRELLTVVGERAGASAAVISGLPPLHILPAAPQPLRWYLGQCANRLDRALQRLCESHGNAAFVSLMWAKAAEMARDRFHPGKGQYDLWSNLVAQQVVAVARRTRILDLSATVHAKE
jgi:lysophospholipase L1-like esterase